MQDVKRLIAPAFTACLGAAVPLSAAAASASGEATAARADAAACTRPTHAAGLTAYLIRSGASERHYMLFVPRSYDGSRAAPVVIDFHGSGSHPEEELRINGLQAAAEARGWIVVLPVAAVPYRLGGNTWNVPAEPGQPDDVRFARDTLDDAARRVCIDPTRVYASGFSGGARLATAVACALSDRIAALGAVGGLRAPESCARAVPVIAFHGTRDPINPYAGGGPAYWGYGVEQALRAWARQNRCGARREQRAAADVERVAYADCAGDARVVLYRFRGAGHTWPGSSFPFPAERFGATPRSVDATAVMLDFFGRHRLPARSTLAANPAR
jgi:polyhydroxybutyrate depolymerase